MTTKSPRSPRRRHRISKSDGPPATGLPSATSLDDGEDVGYAPDDEGADLPPGRMHVVNRELQLRLKGHHPSGSSGGGSLSGMSVEGRGATGSTGSGSGGGGVCPASPRSSRSRSPQTQPPRGTPGAADAGAAAAAAGGGGTEKAVAGATTMTSTTTLDANSSISSLDDIVDQDILYDRAGLIDDLSQSSSTNARKLHNSREGFTNLTPVTERLSEETLEDVHAFSDINPPVGNISISVRSQTSRANSQATDREGVLAALDECAEEDEHDDDNESLEDPSESEQVHQEVILLTNMEKVDINAGNGSEEDAGAFASLAETGGGGTDVGVGPCATSGMGTAGTGTGTGTGGAGTGTGGDGAPQPPPPTS